MDSTLTALIHGDSGVGKSWLAATTPAPRLILDAEGRARYARKIVNGQKLAIPYTYWDVASGAPPPAYDGTWETCIAPIADYSVLGMAYTWLRSGQHPFVSVNIDSLMETQKRALDSIAGVMQVTTPQWGELLRNVESTVRTYRDLTLIPTTGVKCVLFVCGSIIGKDGIKKVPLLQGSIRDYVPYYLDVVGYYFKTAAEDGSTHRGLLINSHPQFEAKDNTDRLISEYPDGTIWNPNIEQLMQLLANGGGLATQPQEAAQV